MDLSRRDLLKKSLIAGAGVALVGQLDTVLRATPAFGAVAGGAGLDGALVPDPAGLLDLPQGFSYRVISRAGDPLVGADGLVPGRPDAMGTFVAATGETLIVQNHEQGTSGTPGVAAPLGLTFDPVAQGGTSTLRVGRDGTVRRHEVSLGGTVSNCAGGITPWGTWLTCEETEVKQGSSGYTKDHGWVFEVDPADQSRNVDPTPLTALGRFPHEAAAVDPSTGDVYLTEDASSPNGLLYRFVPDDASPRYGALRAGGALLAMHVPGVDDLSVFTEPGTTLDVTWKPVPDASAATVSTRKQFNHRNFTTGAIVTGAGGDITRSKKFEGLWWGRGRLFIVCSYAHGKADWSNGVHDGQIWSYQPSSGKLRLEARFAPAADTDTMPDGPDNITVSPYGGLFVAEDGDGAQHLLSVGDNGRTAAFARNALSGSEFTGVVFAPDAKTLFVNIQDDGLTFAVSGPFASFHRR